MADSNLKPEDQLAFERAVRRFKASYQETTDWAISAVQTSGQLRINIIREGQQYAGHPIPVTPIGDMEDSIFTALEQYRS